MTRKGSEFEFIDPQFTNSVYKLHPKSLKTTNGKPFQCQVTEKKPDRVMMDKMFAAGEKKMQSPFLKMVSSDRKYRTLRIAIAVTGEYTQLFGGVPFALAQINATLTRVNAVFENDFAVHFQLVNAPALVYADAATDPFSNAQDGGNPKWTEELQKTLTKEVGETNYDIGHLFAAAGGGGNAGCIGCICTDPQYSAEGALTKPGKGSGFTSPADGKPYGDTFDIDYVAHELGHQLGANHTFSYALEYTGAQVEPGSGSTIMGYAGITGANVQMHSDPYFSFKSIDQVQKVMTAAQCDQEYPVPNTPPQVEAMAKKTIPKGTPYVLTAKATDAENDPLTYTWEQANDAQYYTVKQITGKEVYGPMTRSMPPSTNPQRYIPKLSSVLKG